MFEIVKFINNQLPFTKVKSIIWVVITEGQETPDYICYSLKEAEMEQKRTSFRIEKINGEHSQVPNKRTIKKYYEIEDIKI